MTSTSEADLAEFVGNSAAFLDLQLDEQRLEAAREAMRSMLVHVALVLDYDPVGATP